MEARLINLAIDQGCKGQEGNPSWASLLILGIDLAWPGQLPDTVR